MVITFIVVLPGTSAPEILTQNWQENMTLQSALETAAKTPQSNPFYFALQYGGPQMEPGYNLIMLNGSWSQESMHSAPSYWSLQVNGQPLPASIDSYIVQPGDVITFTYVSSPS